MDLYVYICWYALLLKDKLSIEKSHIVAKLGSQRYIEISIYIGVGM